MNDLPNYLGESVGDFCRRIGIKPNSFRRIWDRPGRPEVSYNEGKSGRIHRVRPTPAFEAFFSKNKLAGRGRPSTPKN